MIETTSKQTKQKIQSKLFEVIFQLPQLKEEIQNYLDLSAKIQAVSIQLNNQTKTNVEEIERVCKGNSRLFAMARFLREHSPPKGLKQNSFWGLISGIINMFTLMMSSPKMIEFFNKLSIPFSIYRIIARAYCNYGKFEFLKKTEVEQSFKFILKMLNTKSKNFPRLYASLILNTLNEYSEKYIEKEKRTQNQQTLLSKESERIIQSIKTIINIALDLIKYNLRLAAESGVLVALYRKAIDNDLNLNSTMQMIETIAQHMNTQQNRDIVLGHLDLCRVFALFTNVDFKFKQGKSDERIQKCAVMIEMLLSQCSTLFYFIYEKVTLRNFVISLKSKSKSERQLSIINEKIFKRLIDKALRYDRNKMQRSNNIFGLNSNYLNYRALLILSFFLDSTELFQIYLNTDPNGSLFAGLGKISLMYFPITFEKGKYNKEIIQTIKLPSASDYERLNKDFLSILSYYDYCIIPYEYTNEQLISYLLFLKQDVIYNSEVPQQNKDSIEDLLSEAKQVTPEQFPYLLLDFYVEVMKICQILPWKPAYLKLSKFISVVVGYLCNHDYQATINACLAIATKIFNSPKPNYFRYLYITALDDLGKYFQDDERVQQLILTHFRNYEYAFRISRILLHTDLNKAEGFGSHSHKKILQTICDGGCEELILQVIEIIRFYCIDYDDKADWGSQIICQKLIYSLSEEIACAAVEFCEEFVINHRTHKNYLYKIVLKNIKDHNLRKRIMYLLLNSEKGIEILNSYSPSFIKDEIDLWLKEGLNQIKQFSIFLTKESKKFTANKDAVFLDIGKVSENRHKLIYLPWNVHINEKCFVALTSYKCHEEKIKLKVTPELLVEIKIDIVFFDIGSFSTTTSQTKNVISVKREEIIKYYERNRIKENKEIKKFAISKQNATLYFKYETGCLVLKKLIIDIPLSREVYRSITYPLSFLTLMTRTGKGFNFLREKKFTQECIKFCRYRQDKQEKDIDVELSKGSLQCLGLLFACWKLEVLEKIEIFTVVLETFEKTTNFQLKEVALWVLNIIVKDDDLRRKLKQSKGWLILESKYCGWLCYPQFYSQTQFLDKSINQFSHIKPPLLPEKLNSQPYKLIQTVLEIVIKSQSDVESSGIKRNQMIEYFKKPDNKETVWDPKLLERVVIYVSTVNVGIQMTQQILDLFTPYYLSEKFDSDFAFGSSLP